MDHVIDEASAVFAKYGSDDLDKVASKLGVTVYDLLEGENLREVYFPELASISVSRSMSRHQRRYVVAHALGHHQLHREGPIDYMKAHLEGLPASPKSRQEISKAETEADVFAAYLLVPDVKLRPVLAEEWVKSADDLVLQLAIEFQVPVASMRMRLVSERSRRLRNQT